jgi:hypothetical protein
MPPATFAAMLVPDGRNTRHRERRELDEPIEDYRMRRQRMAKRAWYLIDLDAE